MISPGRVQRRLQTTEPHGKPQLPLPMTSTFRGISWYRSANNSRQTALVKISESFNWRPAGVRIGERPPVKTGRSRRGRRKHRILRGIWRSLPPGQRGGSRTLVDVPSRALVKPRALLVGQAARLGRIPVTGQVRVGAVERGHLALGLGADHGPSRRFDGLLGQALRISSGVLAKGHRVLIAELVEQLRRWTPTVIAGIGDDPPWEALCRIPSAVLVKRLPGRQ